MNLHIAGRYAGIFLCVIPVRNTVNPQTISDQTGHSIHRHRQRQIVKAILSVRISIGGLFYIGQKLPLSVPAVILPEYNFNIRNAGFILADFMIAVSIIPDNTGNGYLRILLHNTAVISGDICRLNNVIIHAAHGIAVRCISAERFRQNQEIIRLLQIQRSGNQVTVLAAVSRCVIFRHSITFRHLAKLHLIAYNVPLSILFQIGRQIVEPIIAVRC